MAKEIPAWMKSRAAWGAALIALAAVVQTIGKLLSGELDLSGFVTTIVPQFGLAAAIVGIRFKKA